MLVYFHSTLLKFEKFLMVLEQFWVEARLTHKAVCVAAEATLLKEG
jgi:hypothetical protein